MKAPAEVQRIKSGTIKSFYSEENPTHELFLWLQTSTKFLHLGFAAGGARFGQNNKKGLTHTRTVACCEAVKFDVGGHKYFVQEDDIGKHPSSLLYQMTQLGKDQDKNKDKQKWSHLQAYQHLFAVWAITQKRRRKSDKLDEQTLKELKTEADFYGLDVLSVECDGFLQNTIGPDFKSYFCVRDHVYCALDDQRLFGNICHKTPES